MQSAVDVAADDTDDFPVFDSKIDFWLMRIIGVLLFAPCAWGSVELWRGGGNVRDGLVVMAIVALITLLLAVLLVPLIYQVTATHLLVRCGLTKRGIALSSIQSIQPTRSPLAAPALSLDRLRIDFLSDDGNHKSLLISPADKGAFLSAIAARVPELQRHDDGWQR